MKKISFLFFIAITISSYIQAQKIIPLYSGKAPGSETWDWKEQNLGGYLKDITEPTLTAFVPANPNGISVIIAPGGAFHFLVYDIEGTAVAKQLNEKGITAFVLKYRLAHEDPAHPYFMEAQKTKNLEKLKAVSEPVIKLALQDGLTAVQYVRKNAGEYKIDPNKIGFMGFSAGGIVTMSVLFNATDENRPNFVAPIYGYGDMIIGSTVPTARTPMFIATAADDEVVPPANSIQAYQKWIDAKQPVELHLYQKGGHGFGTKKLNLPSDSWLERFTDWVLMEYPLKK